MVADRVLKFGGAALANGPAVERACEIIGSHGGSRPIAVVSAHEGVTDLLETVAHAAAAGRRESERVRIRHRTLLAELGLSSELLDSFWRELSGLLAGIARTGRVGPRELDVVLSFGERMSARVVARVLERRGIPATPVDAFDLGFTTDSHHGRARPLDGIGSAIRRELAEVAGVAVVTGFLAKDRDGHLTTLGRNGSDLTASVIAEAVGAREIQFWKTVGGLLTADPAIVSDARVIGRLTYGEAAELAFHGARVLHPASVAPALRARVSVRVLDVARPESPGTVVADDIERRGPVGIASKRRVLRIDHYVDAPERRGERVAELFRVLEACGVTPGLVAATGDRISAVVDEVPGIPAALDGLGGEVSVANDLASLAVVGQGVGQEPDIGARSHRLLTAAGVEVRRAFLGARAESQSFLVAREDLERAVNALHAGVISGAIATG